MRNGRAIALQDQHRARLLANEPQFEHRWDLPCRAFNLCARIDMLALRGLSGVQESILGAEPSLLRVPTHAMHISVAWLVPVHLELPIPQKDALWEEHGPLWQASIAGELMSLGRFTLRYQDVVATDSAIIALAWPPDEVNTLREKLRRSLGLTSALSSGDLVHTTLFRYAKPFNDPAALLTLMASLEISIEVRVTEFLLVRETIFPALKQDIISRFPLPAGQGASLAASERAIPGAWLGVPA